MCGNTATGKDTAYMTNRPGGGHSAIMRLRCRVVSLTAVIGFNTVGAYLSVITQGVILAWKSQIGEDKLQHINTFSPKKIQLYLKPTFIL